MKKRLICALLVLVLTICAVSSVLAYGKTTQGIYTINHNFGQSETSTTKSGSSSCTVYITGDTNMGKAHYTTADWRKNNSTGTILASSGRVNSKSTDNHRSANAYCTYTKVSGVSALGYGWWGWN